MVSMDGDFPGGCCIFDGEEDGVLRFRPDMKEPWTGNQWFWCTARVSGAQGATRFVLTWPENNEEVMAQIDYGNTDNLIGALPRMINVSKDLYDWQRIESVEIDGQSARFTVEAPDDTFYVAVGIPWLKIHLDRFFARVLSCDEVQSEVIAHTPRGNPVTALRIGAKNACEARFYLQGLQHPAEWAGGRVLESLVYHLLSDAGQELRERFTWHIVPAMNIDVLENRRYDSVINMNRDWEDGVEPQTPEVAGAKDYIRKVIESEGPINHALDLHMGWSSVDKAESSLTAFDPSLAPQTIIDRQVAFSKHVFARCDFTDYIWDTMPAKGRSFAGWFCQGLGVPAQTMENSRHLILERASGKWVPPTQQHEERLGMDLAEAIGSFPWESV